MRIRIVLFVYHLIGVRLGSFYDAAWYLLFILNISFNFLFCCIYSLKTVLKIEIIINFIAQAIAAEILS
ncbi:hypothetical protein P3G55_02275 [Leptospira sp. 96542]|nr:hypothetical protein [Leptospira sp. 96542]